MISPPTTSKIPNLVEVMDAIIRAGEKIQDIYNTDFEVNIKDDDSPITKADLEIIKNLNFNKGDLSMVVAMFSWALYSALLKSKKYEISQFALLEVVIITGLVFLAPVYLIEMHHGNEIILGIPFLLTLTYVVFFPGVVGGGHSRLSTASW